jgi:glycosyltransferase involved in cell wall biosynthesis
MVSVVIPTHNRAHMVGQAIDSVLQQTLSDVEIIVVDDGSTDDTEERVLSYGDRVHYVRTQNGGVAHARNVGMRHARGRYLTFLDSDDQLYPYALELQSALLGRHPEVGLVCAEMSGFDDHGFFERYHLQAYHRSAYRDPAITYDTIFDSRRPLPEAVHLPNALMGEDPGVVDRKAYFGNVFDTYLLNLVLCQNTVMVRREIVAAVGERNVHVKHWQEVDYLLKITRRHTVCFADVPTYKLRYHDGQISTTARIDGKYVWMRKQQILLRVVKRHALADRDYYLKHKRRIDRQLAHLHRAVAVPMLMHDGDAVARKRWSQYARRYLARCARYGHPARALHLAAHAPAPVRRVAVKLVETLRQIRWSLARYSTMSVPAMLHDSLLTAIEHVR